MSNYQDRVIAERDEILDKVEKLNNFIAYSPVFTSLDEVDQELLREQCDAMWKYYEVLLFRIERFNQV